LGTFCFSNKFVGKMAVSLVMSYVSTNSPSFIFLNASYDTRMKHVSAHSTLSLRPFTT